MLALGGVTGVLTGVFAWLLITATELVQHLAWSSPVEAWQLLLVPTVGGLVVGWLIARVVPEVSGGGVVSTMEALAIRGGRLRRRVPLGGTAATSVALGSGHSGGREGPIVLIGGAVGSLVSRLVPLDEDRARALVASGVAAGIGATFNAPIGGMLFAIELMLVGIRPAGLQVVVVSSVAGSVTAQQLVGEDLPLFDAGPGFQLGNPAELVLYAFLGLTAVAVAWAFRRGEDLARRVFGWVRSRIGIVLTVGLGGFLVGVIALGFPEVLGEGAGLPDIAGFRNPVQAMLDGEYGIGWGAAGVLLVLLVAKLVATLITVGVGSAVGTFAPALFTGAAIGGAFGVVAIQLLGAEQVAPGAFVLVGMAAVLAATIRAPLTAILLVFELTRSYDLVLPLMLAVGIAAATAELLGWTSIYSHQLRKRGVVYGQPEDVDVLQTVTVGEVMTAGYPTVPQDLPVDRLRRRFETSGSHGFSVVDDDERLMGVVALSDLDREGETAGEICTRRVLTVTPEDAVFRAVRRMADVDVGRLPVIDPVTRRVLGMLRRSDIVRAYQRGIARSLGAQQRAEAGRLRNLAGVRFVEVIVSEVSPLAGSRVQEVDWPERSVVASVRRNGEVLVPRGDTMLRAGDELVVLTGNGSAIRSLAGFE